MLDLFLWNVYLCRCRCRCMIACRGVGQERQFLSSHCIFTMATRSSTLLGPGPADSTTTLKNRIFLVRHGLAESNVQGVLVSDPKDGVPSFGLVEKGEQQAKEAGKKLEAILTDSGSTDDLTEKIVVITSDFKRTFETAQFIHSHFKVKAPLRTDILLRERGLGEFHLRPWQEAYSVLLEQDRINPTQSVSGCETVSEMVVRVTRVLKTIEEEYTDKIVVLVSHGDPLQVLWAICNGVPPNERYDHLKNFRNCDIREFIFV